MKEKVLAILSCKKSDSDKFNELFALYRSLPGKSDSLVKHFNTRGFSQETFEDLSYQTKKLLSISDLEAASYKSKPCHDCGGGKAKPEELPKKKTKSKEASQENTNFREEYPFLNDLEVPEEFKILAADKISAYKLLQDGHAKLQGAKEGNSDLSEAELAEIEIIQTAQGIKIKTKGTGTADFTANSESKKNKIKNKIENKTEIKEKINLKVDSEKEFKSETKSYAKDKDVKRFDLSAWAWIIILILAVIALVLYWFFGRPRKLNEN